MNKLKRVINLLVAGANEELIRKHKDHKLHGKYKDLRALHVDRQHDDNWVLVYQMYFASKKCREMQ